MAHGVKKPHAAGSTRQKIWTSMRILCFFTVDALAATSSCSVSAVESYLYALRRSGYVRRMGVRGGHCRSTYRLVRDTGPSAPRCWRLLRTVFDVNSGEEFSCE